ncbi:hypothetical protein GCM10010168_17570 [Actinoplanes ianthinogenes]|uniref:HAF family extracellular repeat protein n=1 Tax=Actinoplanes ianthinogenes TaxID=122358 RepID=A0ABM7M741_9ACTN|nr:hypothetical protein [Actinoplanes ianthinogenes]BCJ47399.1 hypothetical protein Aiant_80560 [Actinoplanes ianthinogenes]GGR01546.1 hypothetical protein GCM10010168_17570 [Actinoplanes ianthinogenes]
MSTKIVAVLVTAAMLATPGVAAAAPAWRVIDLGAGDDSSAVAVNDLGQVAVNRADHAYLWTAGRLTDLGDLGGGVTVVADVNNRGEAVGWSSTADNAQHAFRWRSGRMTDLGTLPGGEFSAAEAINERGDVVGRALTGSGEERAVLWRGGALVDLAGEPAVAHDVNDAGQICGDLGGRFHGDGISLPVRWSHGQREMLSDEQATTDAINNRGHVLGTTRGDEGDYEDGVLWHDGGFTPVKPPVGATGLIVADVNDRDQVVGMGVDASGGIDAVLWQDERAVRLPHAGGTAAASAINNRGRIAGVSTVVPGSDTVRAVLWVYG